MIAGIGIDAVDIKRIRRMLEKSDDPAFFRHAYTEKEQELAPGPSSPGRRAEYFAGRFAAKEAVFKAVASVSEVQPDLRKIEILRAEDGHPYVNTEGYLGGILEACGITAVHLSITHEGDLAAAFAVTEKQPDV